jgi:hypothetical protein
MKIKSLEQMEKIVSDNNMLSWDGWNVVSLLPNKTAWMRTDGAIVKGKWYSKRVYEITETGWEIPSKLVR